MLVKDLKALLDGVDDEMQVMILVDDYFNHPVTSASGVTEMGPACDKNGVELDDQPTEPEVFFVVTCQEPNYNSIN